MIKTSAQLGDYTLGRKLGEGQFSSVRIGIKDGKENAVKYIKLTEKALMNASLFELVNNEVTVMSRLDHPSILRLVEAHDHGTLIRPSGKSVEVFYLVFDLIKGGELFDYVAVSGRFSEKLARYYFKQLVEAIEFMHLKGFTHRDIKAENVLLDDNNNIKLADFGFATLLAGKEGSGKLFTVKGTPGYMAPEIIMGKPYMGEKIDIFALGVLLFIMIAQHPPFEEPRTTNQYYKLFSQANETYWEKMAAGKPPKLFSPEFRGLINSLLSFSPALRPSISEIKSHPWYNGPVVTPEELADEFTKRRAKVEKNWKLKAAKALAAKKKREEEEKKNRMTIGGFGPHGTKAKGALSSEETAVVKSERFLAEYLPTIHEQTLLFSVESPDTLLALMAKHLQKHEFTVEISPKKYKIKATKTIEEQGFVYLYNILQAEDNVNCIQASKLSGEKMAFLEAFNIMKSEFSDAEAIIEQKKFGSEMT